MTSNLFLLVRALRKARLRVLLVLLGVAQAILATAHGATLAGHQIQPGGTLDFQFPLSNYFQEYAAQGGNPRPTTGRMLLFFPSGFDPARSWPILIVTSTTDLDRTSIMDAPAYRDPATKEGWIVLATIRERIHFNGDCLS